MPQNTIRPILNKYCDFSNPEKTGLFLLDLPTGFGKTYEILKYIFEIYLSNPEKKIIFLTDLKKNLPHNTTLRNFFKESGRLSEYERDVIFIDSNADSVINNLHLVDTKIPEEVKKMDSYKNLVSEVDIYNKLNNGPRKTSFSLKLIKKIKKQIRLEYEPAFRNYITGKLYKLGKTKAERLKIIKENKNYKWITILYPASLSNEKRIFFLSVNKFLVKNNPIIQTSHYFFDKQFLKNALIFIDEFDSSKKVILSYIIDNQLKKRVDLIGLFERIHSSFQTLELPSEYNKDSKKRLKELKKVKDDNGIDKLSRNKVKIAKIIFNLRKEARRLDEAYNLSYSVKTEGLENKQNFLFHDYQYHTIVSGKKNYIYLEQSDEDQLNKINFVKKEEVKKQKPSVTEFLNAIRRFINFFKGGAKLIAENYQELQNEKRKSTDEQFSFENALRSFFNELNIDEEHKRFLIDSIRIRQFHYRQKSSDEPIVDLSFYNNGFRYYNFEDDERHQTKSKIYISDFDTTPEKMLLSLAQNNLVVGISATAKIKTVIGNYDLKYLRKNLGEKYYELLETELLLLKSEFAERTKNYVPINVEYLTVGKVKSELRSFGFSNSIFNEIWTDLERCGDFQQKRYLKVAKVFQEFIINESMQSFLCFLNTHPQRKKDGCDLNLIDKLFAATIIKYNKENLFTDKNETFDVTEAYYVLNSEGFEDKKEEIFKRLHNGQKTFLITTYQTLGAGQNIQHSVNDFKERLDNGQIIHVFNRPNEKEKKDFDGIYLDKPTNLLVNLTGNLKDSDVSKRLFQAEMIFQNNKIFYAQLIREIKKTFKSAYYIDDKSKFYKLEDDKDFYQLEDYRNFVAKEVIQAIGRINRTNFKNKEIYIYADKDIAASVKYFDVDNYFCLKEFEALVEQAQFEVGEDVDNSSERLIEIERNNLYTHGWINAKIRNQYWSDKDIEEWEELRRIVLKYPTISQKQYEEVDELRPWQFVYTPMLDERNERIQPSDSYYFNRESDFRRITMNFQNKQGEEVSEKAVNLPELMNLAEIQSLFVQKGYARKFQVNEYIISPEIFNNIYKGALGEEIGKFLLEKYVIPTDSLKELPSNIYERFDFVWQAGIFIDFKFWQDTNQQSRSEQIDKIFERKIPDIKQKGHEFKKVFIINIFGNERFFVTPSINEKIVEVPYLIDNQTFTLSEEVITKLQQFFHKTL